MSQRPNTKSTSGIFSVGAVGAAGPHVVLEPGGLRALVGWPPRFPEPQTDTATHLQVAYFLLVLPGLLVPMLSSNLGASSPGGWPHDFKKQPGTPNNYCLLIFLLCPQDLGATQAPQQIHRWHIFSRCVCSFWPLVFLIKPGGALGGLASRLREATGHTTTTTGYLFPIGAPDCQHQTKQQTIYCWHMFFCWCFRGCWLPMLSSKLGGGGASSSGGWAPRLQEATAQTPTQHTAHSTPHSTQPQHHTTHNHNTTTPQHTQPQNHNTQHTTQHTAHNTRAHDSTNTQHTHNTGGGGGRGGVVKP